MRDKLKRNDLTIYDKRCDAWWDHDDPIFSPLHAMTPAKLAYVHRQDGSWQGLRVADVGCGGGYLSEQLAQQGARVIGIDVAEGAIRAASIEARKSGLEIHYVQANADALPLADASVERVICTDVLVHVPDPAPVVREIGRVLKPGGKCFFSTINRSWFARFVMITLAEDLLKIVHRGTHDPDKFIRPEKIKTLLKEAGMELIHTEGLGPIGFQRPLSLVFGRIPFKSVMYQGVAVKLRNSS